MTVAELAQGERAQSWAGLIYVKRAEWLQHPLVGQWLLGQGAPLGSIWSYLLSDAHEGIAIFIGIQNRYCEIRMIYEKRAMYLAWAIEDVLSKEYNIHSESFEEDGNLPHWYLVSRSFR
jgi:hypothetical protein